ncbi:MAG: CocE/NonD family hydrolase [Acidobacteriota bacterium]
MLILLLTVLGTLLAGPSSAQTSHAQAPSSALPSETPAKFTPVTTSFNYTRRDVMIPMRDGVKVVQDIRGKHGSQGDFVMNRPVHGPLNPTPVDESTDTYDTIDWLVKHVPESNGKVGILGISYDGFLTLMALVHPHPALKVAVPMNPMVDGWRGDDWFHNGAFREQMMPYIYEEEASRKTNILWWTSHFDDYDTYLQAVSAGRLGRSRGMEQLGFWRKILKHPSYDTFWSEQAVDKILAAQPLKVPTMLVDSLWDQEDIYGAIAVYKAIKPKDTHNDKVFLVMGPWHHGQEIEDGSSLGALKFNSDTGLYFREKILRPFLAQYLKDGAPKAHIAPVTAFETGTNTWRRLPAWPAGCASGCTVRTTPLYLEQGLKLSFAAPQTGASAFDQYVSDPAKPVPYRARPIMPVGYSGLRTWPQWLVDDQREESGRQDVLAFVSDVLKAPLKISGQPVVHLVASTSGTDSDWVVKLIDVYPDEVASEPKLGGYQLMISADIFRGRYRESFAKPEAITPNKPLLYRFELPTANHVFLPGHRIMVQIQSSWFPLYDRNPQTFVPNIFWAKPGDYRKATQRVYHTPGEESFIDLPLVTKP